MPKEQNLELKVGAFVLIALTALTIFIFSISDFSIFEKGKTMKAIFGFANGLKKSAPVRLAGVDAGSVRDIKVFYDENDQKTKVEIDLWLKKDTEVPADSRVWINQLGLLGEKYVEIIPGQNAKQLLEEGGTLVGEDPIAVEQISDMITKMAKKLEVSIDGFNAVVQNEKNKKSLEDTLYGVSMIVDNIKQGKGTVGKLLYDESIFSDLESFTSDIKANPWKLLYRPKTQSVKP